jgi:hypothetical protein
MSVGGSAAVNDQWHVSIYGEVGVGVAVLRSPAEVVTEIKALPTDWTSSLHVLCKACSEGTPHDHDEPHHPRPEVQGPRRVAVAARNEAEVRALLADWLPQSGNARVASIELELTREDC